MRMRKMHFTGWIDLWWRDLRYGVRQLRRSPAFTLIAVSALAVGVGANVTLFSLVNGWLFRPLDAKDPGQLIRVTGAGGDSRDVLATESDAHIRPADYLQYRDRNQTFAGLAASQIGGPTRVRWDGPTEMIPVTPVTGNYFELLGVTAALGRTLAPGDAAQGRSASIVLSDAGWRRFFRADSNVIGTTVFLDGVPHTIVGVLPDWFTGTLAPMVPQIYRVIPERADGLVFPSTLPVSFRRLLVIGRLASGASHAQARADLQRIATQLTAQDHQQRAIEVYPARTTLPFVFRGVLVVTLLFAVIVGVVLLITCDNIAILTTLRSAARSREIAVRLALGASRSRIVTQLVVETALLCVAAGLVATYLAFATARFATQFYVPVPMPFALTFKPDWRVLLFATLVSSIAVVLCGLLPALKTLKTDLVTTLKGTGLGQGVQAGLVVIQMALSTALLVSAGVLAHSAMTNQSRSLALVSDRVLMSTVALVGDEYTPDRRLGLIQRLLDRLERSAGVSAAAVVASVPVVNNAPPPPAIMRSEGVTRQVQVNLTSHGLFRTLAIPLLAGRDFSAGDDVAPAAVGIVNESLARAFWPGQSPVGKQLQDNTGAAVQVIGLVRDSEYGTSDDARQPFLYRPLAMAPSATPTFLFKSTGDPRTVLTLVRAALLELDPDLAAYNVMPMDDRLNLGVVLNRAAATVSGGLGLLALALGAIGIYGTMSFLVQQRQREIGIRIALGASRGDVVGQISNMGLRWAGSGLAIGLVLAGIASLGLSRVLRGVTPGDPLAFAITGLLLIGVAYLACQIPARRASRVDPIVALRVD
jgi:predicted permease